LFLKANVGRNRYLHEPGDCDATHGENFESAHVRVDVMIDMESSLQILDEAIAWNLNAHVMGKLPTFPVLKLSVIE
jgi:hypothetical protein